MLVGVWLQRYWQPLAAGLLGIGISYYTWNEPLKVMQGQAACTLSTLPVVAFHCCCNSSCS
jgi:hypothetical protein